MKKNVSLKTKPLVVNPPSTFSGKWRMVHLVIIFLLGFGLYSNTFNHQWALDDSLVIIGNSYTKQGVDGLKDIWTHDMFVGAHGREFDLQGGRYRPLSLSMFAIEYEIWGENPTPGHIINAILYGLTGMLIYWFLLGLLGNKNETIPFLAALLFMAHPIHTEVIANIKSRDEILSFLFILLSFTFFIREGKWNLILSGLLLFISLLSKENTITAMAVFPLLLLSFKSKSFKESITKTLLLLVLVVIYLGLREVYSAGFSSGLEAKNVMDSPYLYATVAEKWATILFVAGRYISLLFLPVNLSYDYSFAAIPYTTFSDWRVILSMLVIGSSLFFALRWVLSSIKGIVNPSLVFLGIWIYFTSFSLISNVVFNVGAPMGERFIYFSSFGFVLFLVGVLNHFLNFSGSETFKWNLKLLLPIMLLLPIASYATYHRNKDWKNNYSLYRADINKVPTSARAQMFIGIECLNKYYKYKNQPAIDSSLFHLNKSVEIHPEFYHAWYNLGLAYMAVLDFPNAKMSFEKVLSIEPKHINSHYYLGMVLARGYNETQQAIELMEKGLLYGYDGNDGYINLGVAYGMSQQYEKSINAFTKALEKNPNNAQIYQNLAITYQQMGNAEKAAEFAQKANKAMGVK